MAPRMMRRYGSVLASFLLIYRKFFFLKLGCKRGPTGEGQGPGLRRGGYGSSPETHKWGQVPVATPLA